MITMTTTTIHLRQHNTRSKSFLPFEVTKLRDRFECIYFRVFSVGDDVITLFNFSPFNSSKMLRHDFGLLLVALAFVSRDR